METIDFIIGFENGNLNEQEIIKGFKDLYLNGLLFQLQGLYHRTFYNLVDSGLIDLKQLLTLKKL